MVGEDDGTATEVTEQISCPPGAYGPVMVVVGGRQTITRISEYTCSIQTCVMEEKKAGEGKMWVREGVVFQVGWSEKVTFEQRAEGGKE